MSIPFAPTAIQSATKAIRIRAATDDGSSERYAIRRRRVGMASAFVATMAYRMPAQVEFGSKTAFAVPMKFARAAIALAKTALACAMLPACHGYASMAHGRHNRLVAQMNSATPPRVHAFVAPMSPHSARQITKSRAASTMPTAFRNTSSIVAPPMNIATLGNVGALKKIRAFATTMANLGSAKINNGSSKRLAEQTKFATTGNANAKVRRRLVATIHHSHSLATTGDGKKSNVPRMNCA